MTNHDGRNAHEAADFLDVEAPRQKHLGIFWMDRDRLEVLELQFRQRIGDRLGGGERRAQQRSEADAGVVHDVP